MMMHKLTGVILIFLAVFLGWYFGYISGAKNQMYFNAVARASLYEKAISLSNEEARQMLNGFLFKQKCLLGSDFNYNTYTVMHPIHNDVLKFYKFNIERICGDFGCKCEAQEEIEKQRSNTSHPVRRAKSVRNWR